ncbi:CLUMA_CG018859, isoform A [Clunio marinus]|uniref:Carbonic anhydrase n=1 Tax=Clunio marinus TaxID=568069 RepID=A0A1J1J0H2_9DIPT|nr:CLUMA_CG018859, isoform A [Clunio marinus]
MFIAKIVFILTLATLGQAFKRAMVSDQKDFSYDFSDPFGPQNWGRISKTCDGNRQSPINLPLRTTLVRPRHPLTINDLTAIPASIDIMNDGHGAKIMFNFPHSRQATVTGGPLRGEYIIENAHWHWGENDFAGSEHLLDGRRFSAELHVVTYNSKYGSLTEAVNEKDGLAVLGVFYELSHDEFSDFPITPFLHNIIHPKSSCTEDKDVFTILDVVKTTDFNFLSYKGSLTTPNCDETVTWMVSTTPLKISSHDLHELRKLRDDKGDLILRNYRPIQNRNFRTIRCFLN